MRRLRLVRDLRERARLVDDQARSLFRDRICSVDRVRDGRIIALVEAVKSALSPGDEKGELALAGYVRRTAARPSPRCSPARRRWPVPTALRARLGSAAPCRRKSRACRWPRSRRDSCASWCARRTVDVIAGLGTRSDRGSAASTTTTPTARKVRSWGLFAAAERASAGAIAANSPSAKNHSMK